MGHRDPGLGNEVAQLFGDLFDALHPVVDEEDLAFPKELPTNRLRDRTVVELAHVGEDRLPVRGRRV